MSCVLFDSHCHLDFAAFDDERADILQQCRTQHIAGITVPGTTAQQWPALAALVAAYPHQLSFGVGLHPYFANEHQPQHIAELEQYLRTPPAGLVAVGECGLDKMVDALSLSAQQTLLEQQLVLAKQYDFPVILHVRKAHPELQQLLKKVGGLKGVVHAFTGSYELARSYVELGMKLGIGGAITYPRGHKTRAAVAKLPLSALVLETDAPDMPLYGYQGQRNSPVQVRRVFRSLCAERSESESAIAAQLWQNTQQLFWRLKEA